MKRYLPAFLSFFTGFGVFSSVFYLLLSSSLQQLLQEHSARFVTISFDWQGASQAWNNDAPYQAETYKPVTARQLDKLASLAFVESINFHDNHFFFSEEMGLHRNLGLSEIPELEFIRAQGIQHKYFFLYKEGLLTLTSGKYFSSENFQPGQEKISIWISRWLSDTYELNLGSSFQLYNGIFERFFDENGPMSPFAIYRKDNLFAYEIKNVEVVGIFDPQIPPQYSSARQSQLKESLQQTLIMPQWAIEEAKAFLGEAVPPRALTPLETSIPSLDPDLLIVLRESSDLPQLITAANEIFPDFYVIDSRTDLPDLWIWLKTKDNFAFKLLLISLAANIFLWNCRFKLSPFKFDNSFGVGKFYPTLVVSSLAVPTAYLLVGRLPELLAFFPEWSDFQGGPGLRFSNVRQVDYFISHPMDLGGLKGYFKFSLTYQSFLLVLFLVLIQPLMSWFLVCFSQKMKKMNGKKINEIRKE